MSSKKKILIIDDEPDIGEYVLDTIMPHYPNSRFISDAKIALSCLQKQSFDLVISDINMPGLRGSELVRNLRAHGDLTLVMFLTGNMSKENVLSALRLGVADVMEKPFNEDELIKTVQRIFEIDKRKTQLILDRAKNDSKEEGLVHQEKMLGLLQLANEQKKVDEKK